MFKFLVCIALKKRKLVYILTGILTLFFMGVSENLKMNTDWKELLPKTNKLVDDYATVTDYFSNMNNVIVIIKGKDHKSLAQAADKITSHLKSEFGITEDEKRVLAKIKMLFNSEDSDADKISKFAGLIKQISETKSADAIKNITQKDEKNRDLLTQIQGILANSDTPAKKISKIQKIDISTQKPIKNVYHKLPQEFFSKHLMMMQKSNDLENYFLMLKDPNIISTLDGINTSLEKTYSGEGSDDKISEDEQEIVTSLQGLVDFTQIVTDAAAGEISPEKAKEAVELITIGSPYFYSRDRTQLMLFIETFATFDDSTKMVADVEKIMTFVENIVAEKDKDGVIVAEVDVIKFPNIDKVEFTGMGPIGVAEMSSISFESTLYSIIAIVVILILLTWAFKSFKAPILGIFVLVVGIIWSLGLLTILYERLTMFTMIITFILIGLGIDFVIHIISRYSEERGFGKTIEQAVTAAIKHTGPAVIIGGLTTAAAFFVLSISDMPGLVEFGIATGAGVTFQLIATFVLLPSLLVTRELKIAKKHGISAEEALTLSVFKSKKVVKTETPKRYEISDQKIEEGEKNENSDGTHYKFPRTDFPILGKIVSKLTGHPVLCVVIVLLVFTSAYFGLMGAAKNETEYNFLKLEPKNIRSVDLQKEIIKDFDMSPNLSWILESDIERTRALTEYYKTKVFVNTNEGDKNIRYKAVGMVDSITNYVHTEQEQKKSQKMIQQFKPTIEQKTLREIRNIDVQWFFDKQPVDSEVVGYNKLEENKKLSSVVDFDEDFEPAILKRLEDNFKELYQLGFTAGQDKLCNKLKEFNVGVEGKETILVQFMHQLRNIYQKNPAKTLENLNQFNQLFFDAFRTKILSMCNDEFITEEMLPAILKNTLVAYVKSNDPSEKKLVKKYCITVYPKKDVWEKEHLVNFTDALTQPLQNPIVINPITEDEVAEPDDDPFGDSDDDNPFAEDEKPAAEPEKPIQKPVVKQITELPEPTGMPQLILLMIEQTRSEGTQAGLYALSVILFLLFLQFILSKRFTFGNFLAALGFMILAALPVIVGGCWMFGLMYLFGVKFNYINYIALPVIIGIGVDDGVHITHRYRKEGFGSLKLVSTSVGKAVFLTSLTTAIGFSAVAVNKMQGLASFGVVVMFGIISCFVATLLIVPAIIRLIELINPPKPQK